MSVAWNMHVGVVRCSRALGTPGFPTQLPEAEFAARDERAHAAVGGQGVGPGGMAPGLPG